MFELDLRSRKPIYEQLMEKIKEAIMYGVLQPDAQLPSVRVLSSQLVVNPNTIQKAYRELEREGYIYSLPGKGSFVAPLTDRPDAAKLAGIRTELLRVMTEALYLGLTQEDIVRLYQEAQALRRERGEPHD